MTKQRGLIEKSDKEKARAENVWERGEREQKEIDRGEREEQ